MYIKDVISQLFWKGLLVLNLLFVLEISSELFTGFMHMLHLNIFSNAFIIYLF